MHFVPGISKYFHVIASAVSFSTIVQSERQPSKLLSLPSSHCSPVSTALLPHVAGPSSPVSSPPGEEVQATRPRTRVQNRLRIVCLRGVHSRNLKRPS